MNLNELKEIAENLDWNVSIDKKNQVITFKRYTDCDKDFSVEIDYSYETDTEEDSVDFIIATLYERYNEFDVSTETYMWLDEEGHGKNGAPYDMMDVYNDTKECETKLKELFEELHERNV